MAKEEYESILIDPSDHYGRTCKGWRSNSPHAGVFYKTPEEAATATAAAAEEFAAAKSRRMVWLLLKAIIVGGCLATMVLL